VSADASTLGWTTVISSVFKEIQVIGWLCFGGSLVITGIEYCFMRHLENVGRTMAATSIGGGLIGSGMATVGIVGGTAASTLGPQVVHIIGWSEALGNHGGDLLLLGCFLGGAGWCWLRGRRHGR
jgi:hypothetical protein